MSKDVTLNGTNYDGVSIVELPLADGSGSGLFKDMDEISSGGMNLIATHTLSGYSSSYIGSIFTSLGITTSYESGMFLARNDGVVVNGEANGGIVEVIIYNSENVFSMVLGYRVSSGAFVLSGKIKERTNKEIGGLIGVDIETGTAYSGGVNIGDTVTIYEMPLSDVSWLLNNWQAEATTEATE